MPWWVGVAIQVGKALFDIVSEAIGANEQKLEELGARVQVVLAEGAEALRLARQAAEKEDALTAKARDEAIARIRTAGIAATILVPPDNSDEEPTKPE